MLLLLLPLLAPLHLPVQYPPNQGKRKQAEWKWLRAEMATRPADRVVAFGAATSPLKRAAMYVVDEKVGREGVRGRGQ